MHRAVDALVAVAELATLLTLATLGFLPLGGAFAAVAPTPAGPGPESVQRAYDLARADNAERHVYDLVIETARCNPMRTGGYACQIDFTRRSEPDKRLYFDVVTLAERDGGWVLLSGLCFTRGAR